MRDFTCTAESPELVETDAHTVQLNGGSIGFESKKVLADEQLHIEAVVDGNGTLVVELNGETLGTETLRTAGEAVRVVLTPERRYGSLWNFSDNNVFCYKKFKF